MKICTYAMFFLTMGLVIMIFPYIMTLFNRFNKDRVLAWRKFFVIISICYLPSIIILAVAKLYASNKAVFYFLLQLWAYGYYFIYIGLLILIKKLINLQLGWWQVIVLGTICYLATTIGLLPRLLEFCKDSLPIISGTPHY